MTETVSIADLMTQSGVAFGTSGARGLVIAMTDRVCFAYTCAFLQHLADIGQFKAGQHVCTKTERRFVTVAVPFPSSVTFAFIQSSCHPAAQGTVSFGSAKRA